jgi:hypothetical protein
MTITTCSAPTSSLQIIVSQFKLYPKNTLIGFVTLELPAIGLTLHECTFHRGADGRGWVGFPARSYVQNGEKKWKRLVDTISKEAHYHFQSVAVRAIENYLAKQSQPPQSQLPQGHASAPALRPAPQSSSKPRNEIRDEDIPF